MQVHDQDPNVSHYLPARSSIPAVVLSVVLPEHFPNQALELARHVRKARYRRLDHQLVSHVEPVLPPMRLKHHAPLHRLGRSARDGSCQSVQPVTKYAQLDDEGRISSVSMCRLI
jgi:hypothetical protein